MTQKISRNDPCLCGSGKKYKQCCLVHPCSPTQTGKRKFKAVFLNGPKPQPVEEVPKEAPQPPSEGPDLIQRAYGSTLDHHDQY